WCYYEGDEKGDEHKKCAISCAKAGNPIGLLTEKGDVYVLVGFKDHDANRDAFINKMADTVSVEGTLVKKGGTQVLQGTSGNPKDTSVKTLFYFNYSINCWA
ncbi:MAG: hypothetical protein WCL08_09150, partial [Verrucomicrobiota bacterium]